ncbi:MAG: hypothetical protein U0359_19015 [Byssovorax sp.]
MLMMDGTSTMTSFLGKLFGRVRASATSPVRVDRTTQVLRGSMPPDTTHVADVGVVELFPSFAAARRAAVVQGYNRPFLPAAALVQLAKVFDDRLFAALELRMEGDDALGPGRREFLRRLTDALSTAEDASASDARRWLSSACSAAECSSSMPLGFYAWSDELRAIFLRDRALQAELSPRCAGALAEAIGGMVEGRSTYERLLSRTFRLTGEPVSHMADLRRLIDDRDRTSAQQRALFPPSRSVESDVSRALLEGSMTATASSPFDALVDLVRAGSVSLSPRDGAGFHARRLWALEPLLSPERAAERERLLFDATYAAELVRSARSILAMSRETHTKQLEVPRPLAAARPALTITPDLSIEPLCTFYARTADAYDWLGSTVEELFGRQFLDETPERRPTGHEQTTLGQGLRRMRELFRGAALLSRTELGEPLPPDEAELARRLTPRIRALVEEIPKEPDLAEDTRGMSPLIYAAGGRTVCVLLSLGWVNRPIRFEFVRPPSVTDESGAEIHPGGRVGFAPDLHMATYPVTVERWIPVAGMHDRPGFQRLCEAHGSVESIARALGAVSDRDRAE